MLLVHYGQRSVHTESRSQPAPKALVLRINALRTRGIKDPNNRVASSCREGLDPAWNYFPPRPDWKSDWYVALRLAYVYRHQDMQYVWLAWAIDTVSYSNTKHLAVHA